MHITKVRGKQQKEKVGYRTWEIDEGKPLRTVKGDPRGAAVHRT